MRGQNRMSCGKRGSDGGKEILLTKMLDFLLLDFTVRINVLFRTLCRLTGPLLSAMGVGPKEEGLTHDKARECRTCR